VQFQRSDAILLALNDRFYNNVAIGAIAHYCRLTENSIEIIFRMCEDMDITTVAQLLEMMEHVLNEPTLRDDKKMLDLFCAEIIKAMYRN
jgi:hypothetical protein